MKASSSLKSQDKEALRSSKRPFTKSDFKGVLKAATKPFKKRTSQAREEALHEKRKEPSCHDTSD